MNLRILPDFGFPQFTGFVFVTLLGSRVQIVAPR